MDTATPPPAAPGPNPAVKTLRFVADLVEAGAAGAELNLTVRGAGYVVSVSPAAGPEAGQSAPTTPTTTASTTAGTLASKPAGPSRTSLVEHFLSVKEKTILGDLAAHSGTSASDVHHRTKSKVEKSAFWVLWSNLQQRGLVEDDDDAGGFRVSAAWVAELATPAEVTAAVAPARS